VSENSDGLKTKLEKHGQNLCVDLLALYVIGNCGCRLAGKVKHKRKYNIKHPSFSAYIRRACVLWIDQDKQQSAQILL
jgi:hypothetical protein